MKKTLKAVVSTLVIVLAMSFLLSIFVAPYFKDMFYRRSYSSTNCLTEKSTEDMDVYDIAKMYRDGGATVAVTVSGLNKVSGNAQSGHGSGVCVASKGYQTSLSNQYFASKGSYIVTNYHVIDIFDSEEFVSRELNIVTEDENIHEAELLWFNEDLDVAIVYCDEVNLNYVSMRDRVVDCDSQNRLDYEQIFTIGTPVELDYINRLTVGNIASNNPMYFFTSKKIYPYTDKQGNLLWTEAPSKNNSFLPYTVLSNLYEDVVDVALGISPGNSGGGCFDANGFLIGLTTLGGNIEQTNGNQMNGMVPIYPIMKVLDKIIDNHENDGSNNIYTFDTMGIKGLDAVEAVYASYLKEETSSQYYFLDGVLYTKAQEEIFNFEYEGYYIISNSGKTGLLNGYFITSCKLNDQTDFEIKTRNDLIYFLLKLINGDKVAFTMYDKLGGVKKINVQF